MGCRWVRPFNVLHLLWEQKCLLNARGMHPVCCKSFELKIKWQNVCSFKPPNFPDCTLSPQRNNRCSVAPQQNSRLSNGDVKLDLSAQKLTDFMVEYGEFFDTQNRNLHAVPQKIVTILFSLERLRNSLILNYEKRTKSNWGLKKSTDWYKQWNLKSWHSSTNNLTNMAHKKSNYPSTRKREPCRRGGLLGWLRICYHGHSKCTTNVWIKLQQHAQTTTLCILYITLEAPV